MGQPDPRNTLLLTYQGLVAEIIGTNKCKFSESIRDHIIPNSLKCSNSATKKALIIRPRSELQQRRLDTLVRSDLRPLILAATAEGPAVGMLGMGLRYFGFQDLRILGLRIWGQALVLTGRRSIKPPPPPPPP